MNRAEIDAIQKMYEYYDWRCFVTGNQATQRAHILANTRLNKKLYGKEIIDSPLNWLPCDGLASNALIDIGNSPVLCSMVTYYISTENRTEIEDIVRENIERKRGK